MLLIQYRGKCTEAYARALHRIDAPCTVVMTLRKLKTVMPSIKPPVKKRCEVELSINLHVQAVGPVMLDRPSGTYNHASENINAQALQ